MSEVVHKVDLLLDQTGLVTPGVNWIRRLLEAASMGVDTCVSVGDLLTVGGTRLARQCTFLAGVCEFVSGTVLDPLSLLDDGPLGIVGTYLKEVIDGNLLQQVVVVGDREVVIKVSWFLEAVRTGHVHGA